MTIRVSEWMSPTPVRVGADAPIATCASRMDHLGFRHLPVVGADGRLVGVVTDGGLGRHGAMWAGAFVSYDRNAALTAAEVAEPVDVVATPDDDLSAVVRRQLRGLQDCVVVVDEERNLVGIVTEHDLLKLALLMVPEALTVADLPARPVVSCGFGALGSDALATMERHGIRHLPVTGPDDRLAGIVSRRDLLAADVKRRSVRVDDLRVWEVFVASSEESLRTCAKRMLDHRIGCLPVVEDRRVTRMVTRRDLIDAALGELDAEDLFDVD